MTLPQVVQYATQKLAGSICDTAITHCNASIGVDAKDLYASKEECMAFLGKEIRFGEAYELGKRLIYP